MSKKPIGLLLFFSIFLMYAPLTSSAAPSLEVSVFVPGSYLDPTVVTSLGKDLGVKLYSTKWYQDWSDGFDPNIATLFHSSGLVPELTWQPQENGVGVNYEQVTSGAYDEYLAQTADRIKNLPFTIRINFAPEMNADWTPWAVGSNGNTDQAFISAWRYVITFFRERGAINIEWIWSPNVITWNQAYTYKQLYPGDAYVTYAGLDGYNWGTSQSWSKWQSFSDVFDRSYKEVAMITSKKILLMEVASSEMGGSKAAWIKDMKTKILTSYPQIQGFTWFNMSKETDWRIESSPQSKLAFSQTFGISTVASPIPTTKPTKVLKKSTDTTRAIPSKSPKILKSIPEVSQTLDTEVSPSTAIDQLPILQSQTKKEIPIVPLSEVKKVSYHKEFLILLAFIVASSILLRKKLKSWH